MTEAAPTLPQMPRRLFACTPSRLAAFDCPRRYRFAYLDRPRPASGPPWAHNTLGAAVHLALARWWSLPRAHRTPDEGERLVERAWNEAGADAGGGGFRDDAQSQRYRDVAARWVRDYLAEHVDPDREPVGVERTVAAPTARLALRGRVDRIDDRPCPPDRDGRDRATGETVDGRERDDHAGGRELVVVDYKTGRHGVDTDDARGSQALALYVVGTRRALRRPCGRVELHHLPSGEIAAFEHTEESLARHVARAEATADDIVAATDTLAAGAHPDEVFPPAPSALCAWCDFRAHCPEGRAAAPSVTPWAALPPL